MFCKEICTCRRKDPSCMLALEGCWKKWLPCFRYCILDYVWYLWSRDLMYEVLKMFRGDLVTSLLTRAMKSIKHRSERIVEELMAFCTDSFGFKEVVAEIFSSVCTAEPYTVDYPIQSNLLEAFRRFGNLSVLERFLNRHFESHIKKGCQVSYKQRAIWFGRAVAAMHRYQKSSVAIIVSRVVTALQTAVYMKRCRVWKVTNGWCNRSELFAPLSL